MREADLDNHPKDIEGRFTNLSGCDDHHIDDVDWKKKPLF